MKEILNILNINEYEVYTINGLRCVIYNFNDDKLLIAFKSEDLDDVNSVTSGLLDLLNEFKQNIINQDNLKHSPLTKNKLSMFLWDLYVICFYPKANLNDEELSKKYKLERDKYLARKIIINYDDNKLAEMKNKYNTIVFPEEYLNEIKINETEIKELIDSIDVEEYKKKIQEIEDFLKIEEEEYEN